jgi:branched-chain amino acid transport system ATP-binding protein
MIARLGGLAIMSLLPAMLRRFAAAVPKQRFAPSKRRIEFRETTMKNKALNIIHDEHRALGAVVHGLLYFAQRVAEGEEPNFKLLWTMIRYIAEFPQTFHHPKEEQFIFDPLAKRTRAADNIIGELREQHHDDLELIAAIRASLGELEGGKGDAAQKFNENVKSFADLTWRHMSTEENVLIPLASQHLTEADWRDISAAFEANRDPRLGPEASEHFEKMFAEIVNSAPAPIGLA